MEYEINWSLFDIVSQQGSVQLDNSHRLFTAEAYGEDCLQKGFDASEAKDAPFWLVCAGDCGETSYEIRSPSEITAWLEY